MISKISNSQKTIFVKRNVLKIMYHIMNGVPGVEQTENNVRAEEKMMIVFVEHILKELHTGS